MKALTVQQPWAWAIFHGKTIENRTQQWTYRGPLAIHAGARWSERGGESELIDEAWQAAYFDAPSAAMAAETSRQWTARSEILGVVDLVDVHPSSGCCAPWGESSYVEHGGRERRQIVHLVLENPRTLLNPIYCKGALGLWTPPADITAQLETL